MASKTMTRFIEHSLQGPDLGLRQSNCGRRLFKEPRHSAIFAPCTRLTPVSARAYNRSVPFARNRATCKPSGGRNGEDRFPSAEVAMSQQEPCTFCLKLPVTGRSGAV